MALVLLLTGIAGSAFALERPIAIWAFRVANPPKRYHYYYLAPDERPPVLVTLALLAGIGLVLTGLCLLSSLGRTPGKKSRT